MRMLAVSLALLCCILQAWGQSTVSPSPAAAVSSAPYGGKVVTLCGHPDDGAGATCGLTTSGGLAAAIAPFILIPFLSICGLAMYGCLAELGIDPGSALSCGCVSGSSAPPPPGSLRTTTSRQQRAAVRRGNSSSPHGSGPGLIGAGTVRGDRRTRGADAVAEPETAAAVEPEIDEVRSDGAISPPTLASSASRSPAGTRSSRQSGASALAALQTSAAGRGLPTSAAHSFFSGPASGGASAASPLRLRDAAEAGSFEASPRPIGPTRTSGLGAAGRSGSSSASAGVQRMRAVAAAARFSRSPSRSPSRALARASAAVPVVGASPSRSSLGAAAAIAPLEIETEIETDSQRQRAAAGSTSASASVEMPSGGSNTSRSAVARPMRYSLSTYASGTGGAAPQASASGGLRAGLAPSRRPQAFQSPR